MVKTLFPGKLPGLSLKEGMKAINSSRRKFARKQLIKRLIKLKIVVIALFVVGKAGVHFGLIQGHAAEVVDFGVEVVHVVFSGLIG